MWSELESKLSKWEKSLISSAAKSSHRHGDVRLYDKACEFPLLEAEKSAVEGRLKKLEELIAKTHGLIDDLNEDICKRLSGGHSLSGVGKALTDLFGPLLQADHISGRRKIRRFLEKRYNIHKAASRDLFALLEEVGTIIYRVDVLDDSKSIPMIFYAPEDDVYPWSDPGEIYQMDGYWEIHS